MRNDTSKWAPPLGENRAEVLGQNARLSIRHFPRQTLLSGPLAPCLALAAQPSACAWPDIAQGGTYALRLRRDRILTVNGPALADGWHESAGVAVSDMSGGYFVLELSGPRALNILNTGTALDLATPSGGVVRQFHRQEVLIYRWNSADTFRLHAQRGQLESLWQVLAERVASAHFTQGNLA